MRLLQLQILSLLEQEHSLVKVAKRLFISQPSISTALKELEQELGCPLLERTNRGVKFTPTGQEILQQAKIILNECETIKKICCEQSAAAVPLIRLGLEPDATKEICANLLVYLEKNKKFDLENSFDNRKELIAKLCDEKLDACIMSAATKEYEPYIWELIEKNSLHCIKLSEQKICFVTAADHPLQKKESVDLSDVLQYSYVTLTGSRDKYFVDLFEDSAKNKYATYIYDPESYYTFLQHTDTVGICCCSEIEKNNARYERNLKTLQPTDFTFSYQTLFLYGKKRLTDGLSLLLKTLKKISR